MLRQRLQIGWDTFETEDIFGMPAEGSSSDPVMGSLAGVVEVEEEGEECVICLVTPRNTIVMPCRHMCVCTECAGMLQQRTNKCPICRTVATQFVTFKKGDQTAPIAAS